jgi:uncharacterized protein YycO
MQQQFNIGDLLIVYDDLSWMGRLIRLLTKSKYVHVATIVDDNGDVVEGAPQGVVNNNVKNFTNIEHYRINNITDDQKKIVVDFLKSEVGMPYDFLGIIYLTWLIITFNTKARNAWDDKNKWTCTELVATAFDKAGIRFRDIPLANISANDIATSNAVEQVK